MRTLTRFYWLLPFLLSGCLAVHGMRQLGPNEFQEGPTEALFNYPFDKVWNATIDSITEFPILTLNKEVGLITTDWKSQPAPFVFKSVPQYFEGVFKAEVGGSYNTKRERLNIRVKEEQNSTRVSIKTSVEVYFDNTIAAAGLGGPRVAEWRSMQSDTIIEGEILKAIETALTKQNKSNTP